MTARRVLVSAALLSGALARLMGSGRLGAAAPPAAGGALGAGEREAFGEAGLGQIAPARLAGRAHGSGPVQVVLGEGAVAAQQVPGGVDVVGLSSAGECDVAGFASQGLRSPEQGDVDGDALGFVCGEGV